MKKSTFNVDRKETVTYSTHHCPISGGFSMCDDSQEKCKHLKSNICLLLLVKEISNIQSLLSLTHTKKDKKNLYILLNDLKILHSDLIRLYKD